MIKAFVILKVPNSKKAVNCFLCLLYSILDLHSQLKLDLLIIKTINPSNVLIK